MARTIVAAYNWESDTFTHYPEQPALSAWRQAVAEIAAKAKATLPECHGRVDSAVKLVLAGDVEVLADGTAKVASQSNGMTSYRVVNGTCECPDFKKAPSGWCKHRIATGLYLRARAVAQERLARLDSHNGHSPVPHQQPLQPTPETSASRAAAALPEAPVSITLKATLNGHEVLVTLRGTDFASVKVQVEQASQWLHAQGTSLPHPDDRPSCPLHRVPLKRQQKHGRTWYSHRLADGTWCQGR